MHKSCSLLPAMFSAGPLTLVCQVVKCCVCCVYYFEFDAKGSRKKILGIRATKEEGGGGDRYLREDTYKKEVIFLCGKITIYILFI